MLLPLAAVGLTVAFGRWPNLRETCTLLVGAALFLTVASLAPQVLAGDRPALRLFAVTPNLVVAFELEPLGLLFALLASGLWIVTSVYSMGYMRAQNERHQTRYYACFALAILGAVGVALAQNLFTLFLFYEMLTLSTYPLVTHHGTQKAMRGGRVYLGVLLSTSVGFLLFALLWTWNLAGTLDFREGGILAGRAGDGTIVALLALYAFGTGKAAPSISVNEGT